MDIAIYGAQGIALGAYEAIKNIDMKRKVKCFLVTSREGNSKFLNGIPVYELEEYSSQLSAHEKMNIEILIATPENVMEQIEESLDNEHMPCHVRLTSERWAQMKSYYHACDKLFMPLPAYPVGYNQANIHLFMAKHLKDRRLEAHYRLPEWITPIQVGAALCDERVANMVDCDGDNISYKNVNYSELTALYWIWKNRINICSLKNKEYYGIVHYRRILELSDDDILRLSDNDIDVVLPYPMPYEPDIEMHHKRYVADKDWEVVLDVLKRKQPEYYDMSDKIFKQEYLYNYNIILAKSDVLAGYCEWLFPLLEEIEKTTVPSGNERQDRYIGYIAETLETLYFMVNADRLNIVHTGCRFLV